MKSPSELFLYIHVSSSVHLHFVPYILLFYSARYHDESMTHVFERDKKDIFCPVPVRFTHRVSRIFSVYEDRRYASRMHACSGDICRPYITSLSTPRACPQIPRNYEELCLLFFHPPLLSSPPSSCPNTRDVARTALNRV